MLIFTYGRHYLAKDLEISLLGGELDRVGPEERNYDILQVLSLGHFVAVTVLMIGALIPLEINIAATEVLF